MPKGVFGSLPQDLTGQVFGKLTALSIFRRAKGGNMIWLCKCKCGASTYTWQSSLHKGRASACRSCARTKDDGAFNRAFHSYRKSAKVKNHCFLLTREQFRILTSGNCHYCGVVPKQEMRTANGAIYVYNGIDRMDNNQGYDINNCVSCCKDCNYLKRARSKEQFLDFITRIYQYSCRGDLT
jgi:hypothetical protein